MKNYTVQLAVEQEFQVKASSFDEAAKLALRESLKKNRPVHDHWVTGVFVQDNETP